MNKNIIYFALIIGFSFALPSVSSIDLSSLVNSYNYNYFGEEVDIGNVTAYKTGDYLYFDVNVSNVTLGTYTFYVDVKDSGNVISGKNVGTVGSQGALVNINVSTNFLSGLTNFNYSLRVYDSNNILVYRETNRTTGIISSYNLAHLVVSTSNSNLNNNFLQVNITLNSSLASTENLTLTLKYNTNYSISKTQAESIGSGLNAISFNFDNETIKSTHHNGVYNITSLSIGQKNIPIGALTSSYNYETFAKSSYFKSYNSSFKDIDADNLTDSLEFNFTIEVKSNALYTIEAEIYDLYGNYLSTLTKNESLTLGTRFVNLNLNGSDIYSKGIDGPYQISESRLIANGEIIDYEFEKYSTSSVSYFDFERPPLPDLIPYLTIINGSGSNSTVFVNLTNQGNASAINVFLDLFDDSNLDTSFFLSILNASSTYTFNFSANLINSSIVVALVDIYNEVDELNETNNLVYWSNTSSIIPNDTNKFLIQNSSGYNVSWLGDSGNIVLKGTCSISSNCVAPSGSLVIGNSTDNSTAYFDLSGNLCLESGSCSDMASSCNPTRDAFIIQNTTGYNMSYIDFNGNLCLIGGLYQNAQL